MGLRASWHVDKVDHVDHQQIGAAPRQFVDHVDHQLMGAMSRGQMDHVDNVDHLFLGCCNPFLRGEWARGCGQCGPVDHQTLIALPPFALLLTNLLYYFFLSSNQSIVHMVHNGRIP